MILIIHAFVEDIKRFDRSNQKLILTGVVIINDNICKQILSYLQVMKKALMPGFYKFETDTNRVETMILFIDKWSYYPQKIRMEVFFIDNPDNVYFTDNYFYNIKFNPELNDSLFNTTEKVIQGFRVNEIKP